MSYVMLLVAVFRSLNSPGKWCSRLKVDVGMQFTFLLFKCPDLRLSPYYKNLLDFNVI